MKELFWMMIGVCIGTIFHADIPVLNTISAEKVKMLVTEVTDEVSSKTDIVVEEIQTPPTKREIRQHKKKRIRKDKKTSNGTYSFDCNYSN